MSAHRILGLEQVPRVGCSPIKAVRELGSERRETVWSLSSVGAGKLKRSVLVREDRDGRTSGVPVVCQWHCWVAMFGMDNR
jgi:hypothetical protein